MNERIICTWDRLVQTSAFFLGGHRGTRTPKHFVNLTGESKNFKMLELRVPLNILFRKKITLVQTIFQCNAGLCT
jgi:hypothetical protein